MCIESNESREIRKRNKKIEKILKENKSIVRKQVKLLLLGTGESGKSTFIKQMRIIHDNGFTSAELINNRIYVFHNTIKCMQLLLHAMKYLSIEFENFENKNHYAEQILSIDCSYSQATIIFANQLSLSKDLVDCIRCLWSDSGVKQCYEHRTQFQLSDSAEYFFENVERFGQPNYIPTNDDIVRIRLPTTGIIEHLFYIKSAKINLRIVDVGGQDNERMKWINCFEGVTSIIFLTALNEYDMFKYKNGRKSENRVNRMQESLNLFSLITSLKTLFKSSFILFLNKKDLLEEKIKRSPLKRIFEDFNGNINDASDAGQFIKELFIRNAFSYYNDDKQLFNQYDNNGKIINDNSFHHHQTLNGTISMNSNNNNINGGNHHHHRQSIKRETKTIYSHFTCATDTENIKFVFDSVKWTILNKNMEDFGLH
uniref:Guanine nucleotide-binding protein G(K) subunit alpha-like n=1 Tax=Dermatophagoides pteronyssinus TaxID=6956 RepID=A0A6P6XPK3_DERPT|nr:guanine nucleotide-binding protein G(k) subunit alpha-like [Dermatophagoides pteronyssinus]